LEIKGDFPRRREIIDFKEYRFQVLEVDNRRILKVKFNRILEDTGNDENGKDTK
jgi:CBS domain containing-hemolysin-like protein